MVSEEFYNTDDFAKFARLCEITQVSWNTIKRKLPTATSTLVSRLGTLGYSQRQLAHEVGFHLSIFGYWKRGDRHPTVESYLKLYEFYEREVLRKKKNVKTYKYTRH